MDQTQYLDINKLSVNPDYDFIHSMNISDDENYMQDNGSPYDGVNFDCKFASVIDCQEINNNGLMILSLNIQSLPAKFLDFKEFLGTLSSKNIFPDILCLQELWQFPSCANFSINGYHPLVYKLRGDNVQGGGVGLYIKDTLEFNIKTNISTFYDRIYESLVVEITAKNKCKFNVGTIYRPGASPSLTHSEQSEQFLEILSNVLEQLSASKVPTYLLGDINIDVLTCNNNSTSNDYLNLLFSHGFLQVITKPTRCTSTSAKLIDHCITNVNNTCHFSRIFTNKISDHFPILYKIGNSESRRDPKNIFLPGLF